MVHERYRFIFAGIMLQHCLGWGSTPWLGCSVPVKAVASSITTLGSVPGSGGKYVFPDWVFFTSLSPPNGSSWGGGALFYMTLSCHCPPNNSFPYFLHPQYDLSETCSDANKDRQTHHSAQVCHLEGKIRVSLWAFQVSNHHGRGVPDVVTGTFSQPPWGLLFNLYLCHPRCAALLLKGSMAQIWAASALHMLA